jgi:hypothetical protein
MLLRACPMKARAHLPSSSPINRSHTYQLDGYLGGEGKDVGAGDDARARGLQRRLDRVDHREPSRGAVVRRRALLGVDHAWHAVQEQRAVAALDEAVVEVEPGQAGVDAHVRLVRLDKHPLHDVVRVGARAVVVVLAQLRHAGAEMEAQQDGHHGRETRGRRRESHLGASTVWPARSTGFIYRITNDEVHVVQ